MIRAACLLALAACNWSLHRMQDQPSCKPFEATGLLAGGSCEQVPPDGVIAFDPSPAPAVAAPPELTRALVERGRDRFTRFCAACHGLAADGDSQVARAMALRRPPSLVDAAAASLPDQRVLDTIEHGYGVMPSYASVLAPRDRYAILHYVRALQHRAVPLASLPAAQQQEATRWLH
ncbi:MAG TPA: cytochrome c [Kofleriaceae bacterium]